ncbi:MAG: SRPBCC domain-containing protein [Actinomycetota bacterium]|nr:MAG: SRPBCC domain-containing protein [Actinomycetota bacterium]
MSAGLRFDKFFNHSPDVVWRVLTEPDLVERWWASTDIQPEVGHKFMMDMGPWGTQLCEVLAAEPAQLIRYSFGVGTLNSVITWRLVPEGSGTTLLLEHDGFDLGSAMGKRAYEGMGEGWPNVLSRIGESIADL